MTQTRFHPWRRLRDLGPTWKLRWSECLPHDVYGFTDYARRTITLRSGMSFEERRCSINHEVEHVLRGPASSCSVAREEATVERQSARLLIPSMQDLADSMTFYGGDYEQAAEDLWVDMLTLDVRLGTMTGLERDYWQRRMADVIVSTP